MAFPTQAGITNRLEYPMLMDSLAGKNIVAKVNGNLNGRHAQLLL